MKETKPQSARRFIPYFTDNSSYTLVVKDYEHRAAEAAIQAIDLDAPQVVFDQAARTVVSQLGWETGINQELHGFRLQALADCSGDSTEDFFAERMRAYAAGRFVMTEQNVVKTDQFGTPWVEPAEVLTVVENSGDTGYTGVTEMPLGFSTRSAEAQTGEYEQISTTEDASVQDPQLEPGSAPWSPDEWEDYNEKEAAEKAERQRNQEAKKSFGAALGDGLAESVRGIGDAVRNGVSGISEGIKGVGKSAKGIGDAVKSGFLGFIEGAGKVLKEFSDKDETWLTKFSRGNIGGGLLNFVGATLSMPKTLLMNGLNSLTSLIKRETPPKWTYNMNFRDYCNEQARKFEKKSPFEYIDNLKSKGTLGKIAGNTIDIILETITDPIFVYSLYKTIQARNASSIGEVANGKVNPEVKGEVSSQSSITGEAWNDYFISKYGSENVEWVTRQGFNPYFERHIWNPSLFKVKGEVVDDVLDDVVKSEGNIVDDVLDDVAKVEGSIFDRGKEVFGNFNIDDAYVKPKHLSTTGGNGAKFLGNSKAEAESILKDAMKNGTIKSIVEDGVTKLGNAQFRITIDAGKIIGIEGETLIRIILSEDGGMISAFPVK